MVLDWFGRSKRASIGDLIAGKKYGKAIELIRAELQKRKRDRRLRLQLADVLVAAGRPKEAVLSLEALADELALGGFAAQAIAVLKRIQSVDPGRPDIEEKLIYLIRQADAPTEDPWSLARRRKQSAAEGEPEASAPEMGIEELSDRPEIGMEEAAPEAISEAARGEELDLAMDEPEPSAVPSDDAVRDELVSLLEHVLRPASPEPPTAGPPRVGSGTSLLTAPLFKSLAPEELTAVIEALHLRTFEPGEIVITEGEPRGSLFIITSGRVRAYVHHSSGRSLPIRELAEGEFFGEISLLSGEPRTATITAALRTELLELDRASLDSIARRHPRVREVLQQFHDERKNNSLEATIRGMELA